MYAHRRAPEASTLRYNPCPSAWYPGAVIVSTLRADNRLVALDMFFALNNTLNSTRIVVDQRGLTKTKFQHHTNLRALDWTTWTSADYSRVPLLGTIETARMTIRLHRSDLPDLSGYRGSVAIDTETMGLEPQRDRLCVVQLSPGDGTADVVQIAGKDWSTRRT